MMEVMEVPRVQMSSRDSFITVSISARCSGKMDRPTPDRIILADDIIKISHCP